MQEQPHHPAQQHNVNHHPAQAAVQYATNGRFIARGVAVEHPVKPAEEPFLSVMLPFVQRFQNGGAQRGGEISATSTESTIAETMVIENWR